MYTLSQYMACTTLAPDEEDDHAYKPPIRFSFCKIIIMHLTVSRFSCYLGSEWQRATNRDREAVDVYFKHQQPGLRELFMKNAGHSDLSEVTS